MSRDYVTTFTVTIATPGVFTATEHGLYENDEVEFETTDTLPTGLLASTNTARYSYWVVRNGITANTFQVSTSRGGDPVITSGSQAGTHKFLKLGGDRLVNSFEEYE